MNNNFYRSIVNDMQNGYAYHKIICDKNGIPCDYLFIDINTAFEKFISKKADEAIGKTLSELLPDIFNDEFDWVSFYGNIALNGGSEELEYFSETLNKYYTIKAYSPEKGYFITILYDKTKEFESETELAASENRYHTIFNQSMLGICQALPDGQIINANNNFCKMIGYGLDELKNLTYLNFTHKDDVDVGKYMHSVLQSEKSVQVIKRYIKKNGNILYVNLTASMFKDGDNNHLYTITTIQDITEQKQLEEDNLALETRLKDNLRTGKLQAELDSKAKSNFLSIISHEMRTPLTTIIGIIQLLTYLELDNKQIDYINQMNIAGESLLRIVSDMLDVTKFESGKLTLENTPFVFTDVMENIITMNKIRAEVSNNKFTYNIDESIPDNLIADTFRLSQVFNNIISNAIKFTHEGTISFNVRLAGRTSDSVDVEFIIKDSGIGMTSKQLSRLFDPFTQADTSISRIYGGTGLGMAISKQLVELMDGDIKVNSIFGEGSVFFINIRFPINNQQIDENDIIKKKFNKEQIADFVKEKRILIVEDHKINQGILKEILLYYKLIIDVASDGQEAVCKIKNNEYDLIFMDIQMPVMDGYSTTLKIRSLPGDKIKNVPILAMSAHAMERDKKKSLEKGMNGYLTKPINLDELEHALMTHLTEEIIPVIKIPLSSVNTDEEIVDALIALRRFHGDKELYKKSLERFLEYSNYDVLVKDMLKNSEIDEAIRLTHSLKGIAANLGLNKLAQSAQYLNEICKTDSENCDLEIENFTIDLINAIHYIQSGEILSKIAAII